MALYQKHDNHKTFFPWCMEKCAEAEISCFVLRRNISPRGYMWFVGVQTCATFCRPPFIQTCWNRRHKWWCRHILGPKIKMRHKTVPNYMPARGQDIELSRNTFSKKDWHMDIVLLHLELSLNFSRHIRHGRVLTDIGLWSRIHEMQIGLSRKAGCPWKPWTFQKRINNWNWCSETYHFFEYRPPSGPCYITVHWCDLFWCMIFRTAKYCDRKFWRHDIAHSMEQSVVFFIKLFTSSL